MKRHNLFLLTFLLFQSTSVCAMEESLDSNTRTPKSTSRKAQPLVQAQQVKERLLEVERKIGQYPMEFLTGEKIFLLGTTGAGKSTLINFLIKNNLEADEEGKLDTQDPVTGSEIGHSITSTTSFPSLCLGPNNQVFVDYPGFGDSDEKENLFHACARNKLFSGQFKILLAVEERDLNGKPLQFLKLLDELTKIISVDELKGSLALVVTKQGGLWKFDPHKALKKILENQSAKVVSALTEDVKNLLGHLTEEETITTRIPFFPLQKTAGDYKLENVRENILASIDSLTSMRNPKIQLQLPAESHIFIIELANDLNRDIENAITTTLKPKVVNLCQQYTNAYASGDNMEKLGKSVQAIKLALDLLKSDSHENVSHFASSFDEFFNGDENAVKEYVKTLIFLKTIKTNLNYLTSSWSQALHPTLNEIDQLIESLGNRLFQKITNFVERTRCVATQSCAERLVSDDRRGPYIEELTPKLQDIKTAMRLLHEANAENLIEFIRPLGNFTQNDTGTVEKAIETLRFLNTLKRLTYPKGEWTNILNDIEAHIQREIDTQQRIIDLKEEARQDRERTELQAREHAASLLREQRERERIATEFAAAQALLDRVREAENERNEREAIRQQQAAAQQKETAEKLTALQQQVAAQQEALRQERLQKVMALRKGKINKEQYDLLPAHMRKTIVHTNRKTGVTRIHYRKIQ